MEFKQFYKCQTIVNSLLLKIYDSFIKRNQEDIICPYVPNYLFMEERLKQLSINNLIFLNQLMSPKMYDYINKQKVLEMLAKCYVELKNVQINKLCSNNGNDVADDFFYLLSVIDKTSELEPPPSLTTAVIGRDGSDFQSIFNRLNFIDDKYLAIQKEKIDSQESRQTQKINTDDSKIMKKINSSSSSSKIESGNSKIKNTTNDGNFLDKTDINDNNDTTDNTLNNNDNNNNNNNNNNSENNNATDKTLDDANNNNDIPVENNYGNSNSVSSDKNNKSNVTSNGNNSVTKNERSLSDVKHVTTMDDKSSSILSLDSRVLSRLSSVYVSQECLTREQAKINIKNKEHLDELLNFDQLKRDLLVKSKMYNKGIDEPNEDENLKKKMSKKVSIVNPVNEAGTFEKQIFEKNKFKKYFVDCYGQKDLYDDIYSDQDLSDEEIMVKKMNYKKYSKIIIGLKDFQVCIINILKRLKIEGMKHYEPDLVDEIERSCDTHENKKSAYYIKKNYGKTNKVSYFKHCTIGKHGYHFSLKREEYRNILINKHLIEYLHLQLIACYRILIIGLQLVQRETLSAQVEVLIIKRRMNDLFSVFPEIINTVKLFKYLKTNNYPMAIEILNQHKLVFVNTYNYSGRTMLHMAIHPAKGRNAEDVEMEKKKKRNKLKKNKNNLQYYGNQYLSKINGTVSNDKTNSAFLPKIHNNISKNSTLLERDYTPNNANNNNGNVIVNSNNKKYPFNPLYMSKNRPMKVNYNYAFDYLTNSIIIQNIIVTDNNNVNKYSEKLTKTSHSNTENVTHSVESSSLLEYHNIRNKFIEYNNNLINNENIYYQLINRKLNNIPEVKLDDQGKLYNDKKNNKIVSMTNLNDTEMEKIYNLNICGNKYTFSNPNSPVTNNINKNKNNHQNNNSYSDNNEGQTNSFKRNNSLKYSDNFSSNKELSKYEKTVTSKNNSLFTNEMKSYHSVYGNNSEVNPEFIDDDVPIKKNIVLKLFKYPDIDVNATDINGNTPLIDAIEFGNIDVIKILLSRPEIDLNWVNCSGEFPLLKAVQQVNNAITYLIVQRKDVLINKRYCKNGRTALIESIIRGNIEVVHMLLCRMDTDVNLRTIGNEGRTPLIEAVERNDYEITKLLLKRLDININVRDMYGNTAFYRAAEKNNTTLVKLFLKRQDLDINMTYGKQNKTILIRAIEQNNVEIACLLLQRHDININYVDKVGESAFMIAIRQEYIVVIKMLLEHERGLDINIQDRDGETVLMKVVRMGNIKLINYLLKQKDLDINKQTKKGETALMMAAKLNNCNIVNMLLSRKDIIIDMKDNYEETALMKAEYFRCDNVIRLLESRGAKRVININELERTEQQRYNRLIDLMIEKRQSYFNKA